MPDFSEAQVKRRDQGIIGGCRELMMHGSNRLLPSE
jgi:hypothetical protein